MTETNQTLAQQYQKEGIKTLKGLAAVRKRPGMYVGSTQSLNGHNAHGMIQIAQEILSNAIDEAYSGFGHHITMTIHPDNSMTVTDEGRGMPKGANFDDVIRAVTVLHSSGKFNADAYANALGQNGVGIKATAALSEYITIEAVTSSHEHYRIKFQQEQILEKVDLPYTADLTTGTTVTFKPDPTIFDQINWERQPLINKLEQSAYLTPHVKFEFTDERLDQTDTTSADETAVEATTSYHQEWLSDHGLADYVAQLAADEELISGLKQPIPFDGTSEYTTTDAKTGTQKTGEIHVEGALIYTDGSGADIYSFANGAPTVDGGYHTDGAKQGIYQAVKDFAANKKLLKRGQSIDAQDTRDGLILTLLVKVPEDIMQFESQSKTKLSTAAAKNATKDVIYQQFTDWLYDHEKVAQRIIQNMVDSKQARQAALKAKKAAREARKTKSGNGKLYVSPKLRTASAKDPQQKELYIVEGDSAASGLGKGRDPKTQAIFPIRGKILNTEGLKLSRVLKNQEISTIAAVLKAGIGNIFKTDDLDYDKVIIASDADPDGYAIRNLLITLFFNFFPGLIEAGHLYYVNAPLFKISHYVKGQQINDYVYSEAERDAVVAKLGASAKPVISRFKGLGEMSTAESKKTLLSPDSRHLTRVTSDDHQIAKSVLKLMMGDNAAPRKAWIQEHVDFEADD